MLDFITVYKWNKVREFGETFCVMLNCLRFNLECVSNTIFYFLINSTMHLNMEYQMWGENLISWANSMDISDSASVYILPQIYRNIFEQHSNSKWGFFKPIINCSFDHDLDFAYTHTTTLPVDLFQIDPSVCVCDETHQFRIYLLCNLFIHCCTMNTIFNTFGLIIALSLIPIWSADCW